MSYKIVQQRLGDKREPIETKALPERFETESRAVTAIKMKIASADHAGYDSERQAWWAHNDGGAHVRYFTENADPAA